MGDISSPELGTTTETKPLLKSPNPVISPLSFIEVKKFSKEQMPEERKEVAREIIERRKGYFSRKEGLKGEIKNLTEEALEKKKTETETIDEIKQIEEVIAEKKQSKISAFEDYRNLRILEKQIEDKSISKNKIEEDYVKVTTAIQEIQKSLMDTKELSEAKDILNRFYNKTSEKWNAYQEELKQCSVENSIEKYRVFFLHGILTDDFETPAVLKGTDWKTKLRIFLSFEPTVSTSTISEGENNPGLWGDIGFILNSGTIIDAGHEDIHTESEGLRDKLRVHGKPKDNSISVIKNVENAILNKSRGLHNELIIRHPKVSGFYVNSEPSSHNLSHMPTPEQVKEAAEEFNMPLFVLKDGSFFEAEFDSETKTFIPKNKKSPEDMKNIHFQLSLPQKEKISQDIMADSPFRIKSPEFIYVDSASQGKQTYVILNANENWEGFYRNGRQVKEKVIAEVPSIGKKWRYYFSEGSFKKEREDIHTKGIENFGHANQRYVLNPYSYSADTIYNNNNYLSRMEYSIKKSQREKADEGYLRNIAFHIYGF